MGRPTTLLARPIHLRRICCNVVFLVVDDYLRDIVNERNRFRFRYSLDTANYLTLDVHYRILCILLSSLSLRLDVVLEANVLSFPGRLSGHGEE